MRLLLLTAGLCLLTLSLHSQAEARPVSYPGGTTVITENNGDANALLVHYSPTAKYSVGIRTEYRREAEYLLSAVQVNNLLKRWNTKESQANIYLKSGVGVAFSNTGEFDGERSAAGFTGITADWENRRFLTSYENRYLEAGGIDDFFMQKARIGVAPYIGDYGDLHTWLMLEVRHTPEAKENVTVTPLVRLFKGTHLLETGISNQGDVLFNYTHRF